MGKFAAIFENERDLLEAFEKPELSGKILDVYAPYAISDLKLENKPKQGVAAFIGGVVGFAIGAALQIVYLGFNFPLNYGGKPFFSIVPAVPVVFELTALFACVSGLVAFVFYSDLPKRGENLIEKYGLSRNDFILIFETDTKKPTKIERSLKFIKISD